MGTFVARLFNVEHVPDHHVVAEAHYAISSRQSMAGETRWPLRGPRQVVVMLPGYNSEIAGRIFQHVSGASAFRTYTPKGRGCQVSKRRLCPKGINRFLLYTTVVYVSPPSKGAQDTHLPAKSFEEMQRNKSSTHGVGKSTKDEEISISLYCMKNTCYDFALNHRQLAVQLEVEFRLAPSRNGIA